MADEISVPPSSVGVSVADRVPAPAQKEVKEKEDVARKPRRKGGSFWKRPSIKVYPAIFGYGVQSYQPMIDYLDAKDSGRTPNKSEIHLPLIEERCLGKHLASNPIKYYNNREIDRYIDKGQKIISQIRQNDAVGGNGGNVLNRTHSNWSMTKKFVQVVKKSHVVDHRKLREEAAIQQELDYQDYIDNYKDYRDKSVLSSAYNKPKISSKPTAKFTPTINREFSGAPTVISNKQTEILASEISKIMNSMVHSKLDHETRMATRRQRLEDLDDKFDDVIQRLSNTVTKMNLRSAQLDKVCTPYDNVQSLNDIMQVTDDLALKNTFRRQQQFNALKYGDDELTRYDTNKSQLKNNLRHLDDEILGINDRVTSVNRRHQQERGLDLDLIDEIARAKGEILARRNVSRHLANLDAEDEDIQYMRKQRAALRRNTPDPDVLPRRYPHVKDDLISDVQARIMNRAGEMSNRTFEACRINYRARRVNVCTPRRNIGDPNSSVRPTRTELNIDNMANSIASSGRFQRRFDIDDECDDPVSNLNTNAQKAYCSLEARKPIPKVPSNSFRVKSAIIRARARNAVLGH